MELTPQQKQFIKDNIDKLSFTELSKQTNIHRTSIIRATNELGIFKDTKRGTISTENDGYFDIKSFAKNYSY